MEKEILYEKRYERRYVFPILPKGFQGEAGFICPHCGKEMTFCREGRARAPETKKIGSIWINKIKTYKCATPDCVAFEKEIAMARAEFTQGDLPVISDIEPIDTRKHIGEKDELHCRVTRNGDVLTLSKTWLYFKKSGNAIIKFPSYYRLSINLKTGALYKVVKDRGTNDIRRFDWVAFRGGQIDYGSFVEPEEEAKDIFIAEWIKALDLPIKIIKIGTKEDWLRTDKYALDLNGSRLAILGKGHVIEILSILTTAPNILIRYDEYKNEMQFREDILKQYPFTTRFKKAQPRKVMDESAYIDFICDELQITKTKQLKKLYRENPMLMGVVEWLNQTGIKKVDNIMKFVQDIKSAKKYDTFATNLALISRDPRSRSFLKKLLLIHGETETTKKITEDPGGYLMDTIRMYSQIANKRHLPVDLTGSIKKIHDKLSLTYKKLKTENREIKITSREAKREMEVNGFRFVAARDTHTLINIGSKMHMCVGSYGDIAARKDCTIYYVVDDAGQYAACIEVRKNKLVQLKGYCDQSLEGAVAEAAIKWVEATGLKSDCYDYEMVVKNVEMLKVA